MRQGVVSQINKNEIVVAVKCASACRECSQKESCSLHEMKVKSISVPVQNSSKYHIGQSVELEISTLSMVQSLAFAYGIPLVIMVATMILLTFLNYSETLCAFLSICVLIPYYLLLSRLNKWLKQKISITIKENLVD